VYNNANAQMNAWNAPVRVIHIDLDHRPDLAQQYRRNPRSQPWFC
jgi:hypothetical protein